MGLFSSKKPQPTHKVVIVADPEQRRLCGPLDLQDQEVYLTGNTTPSGLVEVAWYAGGRLAGQRHVSAVPRHQLKPL